jgi:cell division protein FtsL
MSSPKSIRSKERRKQTIVSKAILMFVFFIVCVLFVCVFIECNTTSYLLFNNHIIQINFIILGILT